MNAWTLPRPASTCLSAIRTLRAEKAVSHVLQRPASTSKKRKTDGSDKLARALRNKGSLSKTALEALRKIVNTEDDPPEPVSRKARKKKRKLKHLLPKAEHGEQNLSESINAATTREEPSNPYGKLPSAASLVLMDAESGWGEDKLRPSEPSKEPFEKPAGLEEFGRMRMPPHMNNPLTYSRRIEGLLEPTKEPTLQDVKPVSPQNPIARLAHGLDRVLFNPGVHWLQDPRSRVYNFPPYLETIPKVTEFAFERLGGFIKSSRDEDLLDLAQRENRTFAGSTSSLSGMLSHIYFLLSGDKDVNTDGLSRHFAREPRGFTAGQRMPASVIMNYNDGVYTIDSDSNSDVADKNILTWMGTLLEKYLTATPEEFAAYIRANPALASLQMESPLKDAYRYAKSDRFVMRSQLDCYDPRLPGTGVFDIKTRACLPIRMDLLNFEENSGYLIRSQAGKLESFEREYYDLIRSAFLKYSFQVRIGNMDGVIVAYHNTARMFGFQYISLQEMDEALFGGGVGVGDRVFAKCVGILEQVAEEIVACFPRQSVKCTFEKLEAKDVLNVWVQPLEWDGEDEDRPIRQLEVKVSNYLDQDPVRGSTAVSSVDQPWTTHWSISKLSSSHVDIKQALQAAKDRQFRHYDIPTGWDPETVGQFWKGLSFSGQVPSEPQELELENFRVAGKRIQDLRAMARSGREETERLASEEMGKPKVWLGGEVQEVPKWSLDVSDVLREEAASGVMAGEGEEDSVGEAEIVDEAAENASQGGAVVDAEVTMKADVDEPKVN